MGAIDAYENEDGDASAPVESNPDCDVVGQALADDRGLIYVFEGRWLTRLQDCECVPPTPDAPCPDSDDGSPCVVREAVDCWHFSTFEWSEAGERDLLADLTPVSPTPVYRPTTYPMQPSWRVAR